MFSIIIPVYNEENIIAHTINQCKEIIASIGNENSEIIVVDDCSDDNTYERAEQTKVKIIKHPHNIGYGRSLKDGIKLALNDIIFITDADGTYPLEKIPELLKEYQKGFDMIVGARQGKHYYKSFFKKINRKILKKIVEFTTGKKIPDVNSGFRVFSKKEITPYLKTLCDSFSFTTSLTLAYMMTGKYVKYIPIQYHKRKGKTKVKPFRDSLRTLQFIVEAILYYNPIKIFIVFSITLIILGILAFIITFIWQLTSIYIFGIGCFLLSILMFGLGLIAVLLKQILQK